VQTQVNGVLAPCTSTDPTLTAGIYQEDFTTTLSCATLLGARSGTRLFEWNNGQASSFTFNRAIVDVGGQTIVTFTGAIVSGEFQGATVLETVTFVSPDLLDCLAPPGITTLGPGAEVLDITVP
jgi:hypothetical protein